MQSCGFSGFGADRARLIRRAESEKSPREVRTQRSVQRRAALNHRKTGTKKRQEREREGEGEREGGGGEGTVDARIVLTQSNMSLTFQRCDAMRVASAPRIAPHQPGGKKARSADEGHAETGGEGEGRR